MRFPSTDDSDGLQLRRWLGTYFTAAFLCFAVGVAGGVALVHAVDFGTLMEFTSETTILPDELTFQVILTNNLLALLVILAGAITFGLSAFLSMFFNGVVLGAIVTIASQELPLLFVAALILPHGAIELPALWIAAGISFRVTHRLIRYLRGIDDEILTRTELREVAVLVAICAFMIVAAAWIEVAVTLRLAEWLTS